MFKCDDVHSSMYCTNIEYTKDNMLPIMNTIHLTALFLSQQPQVGRCTDEEYRATFAPQTPSAIVGDGASGSSSSNSNIQSKIADVNTGTTTDVSLPSLRKVELDWEKEDMSWNADGTLVFKLDKTI